MNILLKGPNAEINDSAKNEIIKPLTNFSLKNKSIIIRILNHKATINTKYLFSVKLYCIILGIMEKYDIITRGISVL